MTAKSSAAAARTGGNRVLTAIAAISTLAGWISAAMIVAAVFITIQMIVIRFVLNGSTIWQTEAVIYLVVAATLIGLSYVQRLRGHVNVDLFPLSLSRRPRFAFAALTLGVSIVVTLIMLWFGWEFWEFAWRRNWKSETLWAVPLWIPYLSIPLGFGLLLLQLLADFYALLARIDRPFGLEDQ